MITYQPRSVLCTMLKIRGSVFPKALVWAIPNAILAWALHKYTREMAEGEPWEMTGVNIIWAGYTSVLGFLVVFRNNQAYTRFWEGATLINQVRGEWFNAVSTLFTFCNLDPVVAEEVEKFQGTLIRLMSLLHSCALQQVCDLQDDRLEIIEHTGMAEDSLAFFRASNDRCEILMQWVQRLIMDGTESGVIRAAPPLLTRAFQELSRGIVNLNNARKIKEIPFPFPYAQMITCMLIVQWFLNPLLASQVIDSRWAACATCFFVTFAFWCLIYIALEIDQPFGEDPNDLPLRDMQRDFNRSLLNMMHPLAQRVPYYEKPLSAGRPRLTRCESMQVIHGSDTDLDLGTFSERLSSPRHPPPGRFSGIFRSGVNAPADHGGKVARISGTSAHSASTAATRSSRLSLPWSPFRHREDLARQNSGVPEEPKPQFALSSSPTEQLKQINHPSEDEAGEAGEVGEVSKRFSSRSDNRDGPRDAQQNNSRGPSSDATTAPPTPLGTLGTCEGTMESSPPLLV